MNTTRHPRRLRSAAIALALTAALSMASAPAQAASPQAASSTSTAQKSVPQIGVKSYWVYVCKTRTEWWDPFNTFGTARWSCVNEWWW